MLLRHTVTFISETLHHYIQSLCLPQVMPNDTDVLNVQKITININKRVDSEKDNNDININKH